MASSSHVQLLAVVFDTVVSFRSPDGWCKDSPKDVVDRSSALSENLLNGSSDDGEVSLRVPNDCMDNWLGLPR